MRRQYNCEATDTKDTHLSCWQKYVHANKKVHLIQK